jgi:membrane-associated phospholipid phosphatase
MWPFLQHIDEVILKTIHVNGQNSLFDVVMPWLRNPYFWSPIYFFLLIWMILNWKWKGFWWCVCLLFVFGICDFTSASLIKPFIHRLRPCNEGHLSFIIRSLVTCGRGYSFPSAHAANHFGISFFIYFTLGKKYTWVKVPAMLWALLVCYAQMYVCVHYPSDILAGALLGCLVGIVLGGVFNRKWYNKF